MLRVSPADELAADRLWSLGAIAVTETADGLEAGFVSIEDERHAETVLAEDARWAVDRIDDAGDDGWADTWREYVTAPTVVGRVVLLPSWIAAPPDLAPDAVVVTIEPGRAFGVGGHPTTRLVTAAVARAVEGGAERVLDVGTGTGVLALVAAALGATEVVAVDVDSEAVAVARANVEANGFAGVVRVVSTAVEAIDGSFDLVVANLGGLDAPVDLASELARLRASDGIIVIGGLLADRPATRLDDAFAPFGLAATARATDDGWAAVSYGRVT